jgi:hypothetical protein
MNVLHFKDVNFQCLIVTHEKERKDGEITVYGPIPTYEAVDALDSVLKDAKWNKELPRDGRIVYAHAVKFHDILEGVFLGIIGDLRNLPFVKPTKPYVELKLALTMTSFVWKIRGNVVNLNQIEIISKIMEDAKKQAEASKVKPQPLIRRPRPAKFVGIPDIKAFGTYFYPPIWIGKPPGKTFKERALGSFIHPEKAFDIRYKERVLVVNEDGRIAIGEKDHLKAIRMLNEIMATGLLLGLPFLAARELEVSDSTIDSANLTITSFGMSATSLRAQLFFDSSTRVGFINRIEVEKEKLISLIREAERISQDPDVADFIVFLLEAYTCIQSSEYAQSFMISWVIIERHMFWLWEKFLKEEQIIRGRRDKLTNPAYWTLDYVLEALNLCGRLSKEDYEDLMNLKNKRNNAMHEGEMVTHDDAERCFKNAKRIVQQRSTLRHP